MKAEIITIGDELLIGQTIDTNSAWMGSELSSLGFDVHRKTSVHDNRTDILAILAESSVRSDLVLVTGGLGPTSDDITKPVLCEFFNTRMVTNQVVLNMVEAMLSKRGFPMNEKNMKQAEVPASCRVLFNAAGTAPGMWFEKDKTVYVSMPGVPSEMRYIMNEHVIPELRKRFTTQVIIHKNIMTYGLPEALLADTLTDFEADLPGCIRLAYLPSYGVIKLRLTATGSNPEDMKILIDRQVARLYEIIPQLIYGEDEEMPEMTIGRLLKEKYMTLCTAESCTGGYIAHKITSVPGSSAYFKGSVIAYANETKMTLLGVDPLLIERDGAVSESVVRAMAEGAFRLLKTDYAVAVSGIAGPGGGTDSKPVGTLWVAIAGKNGSVAEKQTFTGNRITNINRFTIAALDLLRRQIQTG